MELRSCSGRSSARSLSRNRACESAKGARIEAFPVQELGEVLALTLRGASFREGRLLFGNESPRDVQPLSSGFQH